jgi:hypothetical protein
LLESHSIIRASTGWGLLLCNGGFVLPAALGSDWITRLFISALLRPGVGVMDGEFLKQRAEHCRFLAEKADPFIKRRLLDLAVKYDARLKHLTSRSRRTLGIPGSLLEATLPPPPNSAAD